MEKTLDLDSFGDAIDKLLTDADYHMHLSMPPGTQSVKIEDNLNLGPTLHFYALTQGLITSFKAFREMLDPDEVEGFINVILAMVKEEVLEVEE